MKPDYLGHIRHYLCVKCYSDRHLLDMGKANVDGNPVGFYNVSPSTKRICEDCENKVQGRNLVIFYFE